MKSVKRILLVLSMLLTVTLFAGCATKEADKTNDHTDTDVAQSDVIMAKTENYTLSESEMKVLEYQSFNNVYYSLYYCAMYYNYGLTDYVYSNFSSYLFSDITSYSSNPQGYAEAHIDNYDIEGMAYTMAENLLVYNEGADREGYQADADELAEEKKNVGYIAIDTFKSSAEENSMTLGAYIRSTIGDGVSKGDVEKVIDLYARYNLFIEEKGETLKGEVSDEDAEKYREDNKDRFYYTEYVYCELPDEDWITAEVRSQAAACQTLNELQALLDAARPDDDADDEMREDERPIVTVDGYTASNGYTASQVIKITPSEGMTVVDQNGNSYVIEYFGDFDHQAIGTEGSDYRVFFEGETIIVDRSDSIASSSTQIYVNPSSNLFTNSVLDMAMDAFHQYIMRKNGVSDDDRTASDLTGGQTIIASWNSDAGAIIGSSGSLNTEVKKDSKLTESGKQTRYLPATDDDTDDDLTRWLFAAGRQAGDVTVLKIGSTYYWVRIPEGAKINGYNDEKTKVGYYAILKDDTTNEEDAESTIYTKDDKFALIEEANDLSARRDVFESILQTGEKMTITEDDLKDIGDELAEWFYSGDRREGDYARITVGEGDDAKEYAVLFVEENEETWMTSARYYKAQEDLTAWFDAMKVTCGYTENHENS